jgi:RNA recognition motif-containing protein
MRIYVGNLSYDVIEEELKQEFLAYGATFLERLETQKSCFSSYLLYYG